MNRKPSSFSQGHRHCGTDFPVTGLNCFFVSVTALDGHFHLDRGIRIVSEKLEVLELEVVDRGAWMSNDEFGKWSRFALELLQKRLDVVFVNMSIAESVDEVTGPKIADIGNLDEEGSVMRSGSIKVRDECLTMQVRSA